MSPKGRGSNLRRSKPQSESLAAYERQAAGLTKLQNLGERHARIHGLSGSGNRPAPHPLPAPVPTGTPDPDTPVEIPQPPAWLTHLVGAFSAIAIGGAAGTLFTNTADSWSAFALIVGLVGTVYWAKHRRQP